MYGTNLHFFIVLYIIVRKHVRCHTCRVLCADKLGKRCDVMAHLCYYMPPRIDK
jgi:hypothetical protein